MPAACRYYYSPHWRALRAARIELARGRCEAPGCTQRGVIVDHVVTRPYGVESPTSADRLDNLRLLCHSHDSQIRERRRGDAGSRRGVLRVGIDTDGWPLA